MAGNVALIRAALQGGKSKLTQQALALAGEGALEAIDQQTAHTGRSEAPRGLGKYARAIVRGNTLTIVDARPAYRGRGSILLSHHYGVLIEPVDAVALYLPISENAKQLTAMQAWSLSSRRGGPLLEGKVIDGVLHYIDPNVGPREPGRYAPGEADFRWIKYAQIKRKPLYDGRSMRAIVRRAVVDTIVLGKPTRKRSSIKINIALH